jgi:hypothetical protein
MADDEHDEPGPTRKPPTGVEIPVPRRDALLQDLLKAARRRTDEEMPNRLCDDDPGEPQANRRV